MMHYVGGEWVTKSVPPKGSIVVPEDYDGFKNLDLEDLKNHPEENYEID